MTKNAQSKQGLESPTVPDIRCYSSQTSANVMTVPAGSTIHYISTQQINHPGPTQYYLAKVPEGSSATKWDGSGNVWFKFHTTTAIMDKNKQLAWPNQSEQRLMSIYPTAVKRLLIQDSDEYTTVNATIPNDTPSGEYLLRVEQIALHIPNKPQIYLACSQVKVTGGSGGTPGPLVALPGAYKNNDPAIFLNLASVTAGSYVGPGPTVWSG